MRGVNLGAFVQGHEAGQDRQMKQEQLKMLKQEHQQKMETYDLQQTQLGHQNEKLEEVNQAQERLNQDFQRTNVDRFLSEGFKAENANSLQASVDAINNTPVMKGKKIFVPKAGNEDDVVNTVAYLRNKGYAPEPYVTETDENGKVTYRKPNELDPGEMQKAIENAKFETTQIAEYLLDKGQLIKQENGNILGLEDIAAVTGHLDRYPNSRKINDEILTGIREKKSFGGQSTKMQSTFGKFFADLNGMGIEPDQIVSMYSTVEKNPAYGQAIKNLGERELPLTQENIDREVRAIKGTLTDANGTGGSPNAITAYDSMVKMSKEYNLDFATDPDKAMENYYKLDTEKQGRLKAAAKDYFKESKEKLAEPVVLAKHLHTLSNLNISIETLDKSVKSAAGIGDNAVNAIKQFLTTDEGIEFKKKFKQTFNALLSTSNKGHISKAELDNLIDAFGGMALANETVFANFKSMVVAMKSQMDAYRETNPIAGKILYGTQMNAYDTLVDTLDAIDGTTSNKGNSNTLDFGGAQ